MRGDAPADRSPHSPTAARRRLKCLKVVNQHIQRAAKLRVGNAKTGVIAGCREAIKSNDVEGLFRLIRDGITVVGSPQRASPTA